MSPGKLRRFDFDKDEMDILLTALRDHFNCARDTWIQQGIGSTDDVLNVEDLLNRLIGREK